jgi:hypothetical protein
MALQVDREKEHEIKHAFAFFEFSKLSGYETHLDPEKSRLVTITLLAENLQDVGHEKGLGR